jgi:hypothetical protein
MLPLTIFSEWFFSTLVLLFVFIPLVSLWVFGLVDLFTRKDLRGVQIVLWLLLIVFLPVIGILIYFLARPDPEELERRS